LYDVLDHKEILERMTQDAMEVTKNWLIGFGSFFRPFWFRELNMI
jgi:hypothetical protein